MHPPIVETRDFKDSVDAIPVRPNGPAGPDIESLIHYARAERPNSAAVGKAGVTGDVVERVFGPDVTPRPMTTASSPSKSNSRNARANHLTVVANQRVGDAGEHGRGFW